MRIRRVDIRGLRFGNLKAIRRIGIRKRITYWLCECDCGDYDEIPLFKLRKNKVTMCYDCREEQKELLRKRRQNRIPSKEHHRWRYWVKRLDDTLCNSWKSDPETWYKESQAKKHKGHSLTYRNPDLPIGPNNYRWIKPGTRYTASRLSSREDNQVILATIRVPAYSLLEIRKRLRKAATMKNMNVNDFLLKILEKEI